MNLLTFIYTYRERDTQDIKRFLNSLESLKKQTKKDFEVVCVDYGNCESAMTKLNELISQYSFCRVLRTETQGFLWNRSHALNTAIRTVSTPYLATTDIDAIFAPDFVATLYPSLEDKYYLVCGAHELSKDFSIEKINFSNGHALPEPKKNCGIFQAVETKKIQEIGGFDEYYRGWGKEDRDLDYRLQRSGLKKKNLWGQTFVFHQFHSKNDQPEFSFASENFSQKKIDGSLWKNMCAHYLKNAHEIHRNTSSWGRLFLVDDRTTLSFLDASGAIRKDIELNSFKLTPDPLRNVNRFVYFFLETSAGQATLVRYQGENSFFESFLFQTIPDAKEVIADYYFNFESEERFALLIRK